MILLFPALIHFKSEQDKENFAPTYVTPHASVLFRDCPLIP